MSALFPSPSQKLLITVFLSLCATGILGWTYEALARRILSTRAVTAELLSKISAQEEGRRQVKMREALLRERPQDLKRIRAFFPPRDRPLAFIQEVEHLGDVTRTAVVLDVDESKNDSLRLGFRITADGSEPDLLTLTHLIELLPYEISVEELTFQKNTSQTSSGPGRDGANRLVVLLRVRTR